MTKSITKTSNLGYGWRGTLYSDGTMRVHEFDIDDESYVGTSIDLPKDRILPAYGKGVSIRLPIR